MIASSVSITVAAPGMILANGGIGGHGYNNNCANYAGGSGGGGSVRLVAPTVGGNGTIQVLNGGNWDGCSSMAISGANGRLRIEAYNYSFGFGFPGGTWSLGSPLSSYVPAIVTPPAITVTSVAGKAILNPTGGFSPADVTINTSSPIIIQIHARNVPVGTIVKVQLFSQEGPDQSVDTSPLAGTLQDSTASATVTLPAGFTRGYARAKW